MRLARLFAQYLLALLMCFESSCVMAAQSTKHFMPGSYQEILSAHAGKPFIVSLWSLDCTYCEDDMVLFDRLSKKYRDLDLITISTDTLGHSKNIERTLQRHHLQRIESWVFADPFVERLRYEVDAQWYGELPRTYLYDAQGRVVALSGRLQPAKIEQWVRTNHNR